MSRTLFTGAAIFDGHQWHREAGLLVQGDTVAAIIAPGHAPDGVAQVVLDGGMLVPGFVDLQVNGGGGVQFNSDPTPEAIAAICAAHHPFGTTALLPTLITDTPEVTARALTAGTAAAGNIPGFLGLHLEGPHLSVARKGTHDPRLIRAMDDRDFDALIAARSALPVLLTTVAPESVRHDQIEALARAGIVVSLGHSDCDYETACAAFAAGATMATHLHNAMSPLTNRGPGVVGAVLDSDAVWAGLIADGIHVHPATLRLSLAAKRGAGKLFLVTDAMAVTGSDLREITLNGRIITRAQGALRLADGTLAGADLAMIDAMIFMYRVVGVPLDEAFRMAALYPALSVGQADRHGHLGRGARADMVHVSDALAVRGVWIAGAPVFSASSGYRSGHG